MHFYPSERGQGMLEYALAIVLVAVVVLLALTILGEAISNVLYEDIINSV